MTTFLKNTSLRLALALLLAGQAQAAPSIAREWNEQILKGIRRNVPNPPAHARNLHHLASAMYDAWAAYDATSIQYLKHEKVSPLPVDVEAARRESIAYAAFVVIRARFSSGAGSTVTVPELDALLTAQGYSPTLAKSATTTANTPAMLGKRCADRVLLYATPSLDGFSNTTYPVPYDSNFNSNMSHPLAVLGENALGTQNQPLGAAMPSQTNPNLWQPLALSSSITQNGQVVAAGPQSYIGLQGMAQTPFSLKRADNTLPWLDPFNGPPMLSTPTFTSPTNIAARNAATDVLLLSSKLNSQTLINVSPGALGNNTLGADDGSGHAVNPVTGLPYAAVQVKQGDYGRVLAEYWADGPDSETPPGHWHVLANQVTDLLGTQKRIGGVGPIVSDLEWDVKMYFSLAGSLHDAACGAWALKRYYSGSRPITQIRWMGAQGQSGNTSGANYSPYGIPLIPGVSELITWSTVNTGGRHEEILDLQMNEVAWGGNYVGQVAIFSWPGEHKNNAAPTVPPTPAANQNPVRWMLARDWLPFQRKTFNTPAFPGYVSGHSTFSRAAAEVLTKFTGTPNFPGGYHSHTFPANSMQIDRGPSAAVKLGWTTYFDAADQAGQSRRWGGIHVAPDDFHGRIIGAEIGKTAYALASSYWDGSLSERPLPVEIEMHANGNRTIRWEAIRGLNHRVQRSTLLQGWTDLTSDAVAYDTKGSYTDTNPKVEKEFYRVIASGQP
jgi:hypothetical protein